MKNFIQRRVGSIPSRTKSALKVACVLALSLLSLAPLARVAQAASTPEGDQLTRAERKQAELAEKATRAKEREARERSISEQRLYDLLVSIANSKRHERRAGYRDEVFQSLRQAASLDVPHKDLLALRDMAVSCLGDVAGLTPVAITNFPANTEIEKLFTDASGRLGAFTLSDGTIELRNLPSGEEVARLNLNGDEPAERCVISQDGKQLLSLHMHRPDASQNSVRLWARGPDDHWAESGRMAVPHADNVGMLDDKPFVCFYDRPARVYKVMDLATQKVIVQLEHIVRQRWILSVLPTSTGLLTLVTRDGDGSMAFTIHVWDVRKGVKLKELHPRLGVFAGLYPSRDGRFLACIGNTGAEIYALNQLELVAELPLRRELWEQRPAAFARNNSLLAISVNNRQISVWDWASKREVIIFDDDGVADSPPRLEFDAHDRYLIAVGKRQARLYPVLERSERTWLSNGKAEVTLAGFSPDSQRFAWAWGGDLVVGDVWTGRSLWQTNLTENPPSVTSIHSDVSFNRDGLMAVASCLDPRGQKTELSFWHGQRRLPLLNASTNEPPFLFFPELTPDGRFLVAQMGKDPAMNDAQVHVWRVNRPSAESVTDSIEIQHVMTAPDRLAATAVHNHRIAYARARAASAEIHLVELEGQRSDRIIGRGAPGQGGLQWFGFTPDGHQLLVVNTNHEIVALDIATGAAVTPPIRAKSLSHAKAPTRLNFSLSPDGLRLAIFVCVDRGSGVEIWDWKARRYLYSLPEPTSRVLCARWSPDSQHLAVCGSETSIWHLDLVERQLAELGFFEKVASPTSPEHGRRTMPTSNDTGFGL